VAAGTDVACIFDLHLDTDPYEGWALAWRHQTFNLQRTDTCHQKIAGPHVSANYERKTRVKLGIKATLRVASNEKI